jgi:hypothetical protein
VLKVLRVLREHKVLWDLLVILVHVVQKAPKEPRVQEDLKETLVFKELRVVKVFKVLEDHRVQKGLRVLKEP